MYSIKQISSQETLAIRQTVLRPGKPIDSCIFDGDDLDSTFHIGIYEGDNLAGILSGFEVSSSLFTETRQFQLRGMAVLEAYQKKGLGDQLMQYAEALIKQRDGTIIWFNARKIAVGFYSKMNYNIIGEPFEIGDIGIHYVMYRRL
jgi:ribosomal protein S18 acetylase RimI-like enzyme